MSKKHWERKECNGCKSYNPECKQGTCNQYPYKKKKKVIAKREYYDTG